MERKFNSIEIGLVLQGGGALGAYEWGAIEALFALMDDFDQQQIPTSLVAVSGVSIGAINGACVVGAKDRADARARLKNLWKDLAFATPFPRAFDLADWGIPLAPARDMSLFGLPGFYVPRFDIWNFWNWISVYKTYPIEDTLKKHVAFEEIDRSKTLFSVTAVEVESGRLRRFRNRPDSKEREEKKPEGEPHDNPNIWVKAFEPKHILASGSLAPQFPWTDVEGASYWDGGIVDNTPSGDAMEAFSRSDEVFRLIVVMNLYPLTADTPRGLLDVMDRVHELSYGNRVRQDRLSTRRINEFLRTIHRLADAAKDVTLDEKLAETVEKLRLYKIVKTIEVDLQVTGGPQDPEDGEAGLRDFSPETIKFRRHWGYKRAYAALTAELAGDQFFPKHAAPTLAPMET